MKSPQQISSLIFEPFSLQHGKFNDQNYSIRIRKGEYQVLKISLFRRGRGRGNWASLFTTKVTEFQESGLIFVIFISEGDQRFLER